MRYSVICIGIVWFLSTAGCASAEFSINAEVDKKNITTADILTYKLTIYCEGKNTPSPSVPSFEGFLVLWRGQSSSVRFSQGKSKTTIVYTYLLLPKQAGRLQIGPSSLSFQGQTVTTETFTIEVDKAESTTPIKPKERFLLPEEPLPEEDPEGEVESPRITL